MATRRKIEYRADVVLKLDDDLILDTTIRDGELFHMQLAEELLSESRRTWQHITLANTDTLRGLAQSLIQFADKVDAEIVAQQKHIAAVNAAIADDEEETQDNDGRT